MTVLLFMMGVVNGVITGLLAVGGGIVLIGFLLIVSPLLHIPMNMYMVAGFSFIQATFMLSSSAVYYLKQKIVDLPIVIYMGSSSFVGGLLGSYLSQWFSENILKGLYAVLSLVSVALILFPQKQTGKATEDREEELGASKTATNEVSNKFSDGAPNAAPNAAPNEALHEAPHPAPGINRIALYVLTGLVVSFLGGLIGLGGAFLTVPILLKGFHLPIRKAIGSTLVISFFSVFGGLLPKLFDHVVQFWPAIALAVGGIVGGQIGSRMSKKFSAVLLKRLTSIIICLITLKVLLGLF